MRLLEALPSSLLALLALVIPPSSQHESWAAKEQEWPSLSPREAEIFQKLKRERPMSIRKMSSDDPGQMFHISDWYFDEIYNNTFSNSTTPLLALPILPHGTNPHQSALLRPLSRLLNPRAASGFSCPSDTNSCASIGADYGCCPQGTTCQIGDKGSLGCCPGSKGTCVGNTPTNCEAGYSSCALFHGGGGCCAQGFECASQGCIGFSTTVVVVYPTVTATSSSTSSTPASSSATTTSTTSSTSTSTTTSTTSTSTSTSTTPTSSTQPESSLLSPIPATSLSITTITSSIPTTITIGPCPTGYYACSAVFNVGACCQVGRDCGRTSCPPLVTSTALVSDGITIADVSASGLCATGWSTCAAGVGGGCCPTGYACGTQLCSATVTGAAEASLGSVVAKEGGSVAGRTPTKMIGIVGMSVALALVLW